MKIGSILQEIDGRQETLHKRVRLVFTATRARVYRQAQRGPHIDLTAPGVNMLSATSIRGARLKSGTSFAVPFVTAAVAMMLSQDEALTPDEIRTQLLQSARDLGASGVDDVFGHGLLNAGWLC